MEKKFDVIFDNGGGITIQVGDREYAHYYGGDAGQAGQDAALLLGGADPAAEWDGNELEVWQEYDAETERNGGYDWLNQSEIAAAAADAEKAPTGAAAEEFFAALRNAETAR